MTALQVFKKYFQRKVLLWSGIFILIFCFRYYKDHSIQWDIALMIFGIIFFAVIVLGFSEYWFYEKRLKNLVLELINETPLKEFQGEGFILDEDDKLSGFINGFNIFLTPMANIGGEKYLAILIPIEPKADLEKYLVKFDDYFRISASGEVLFVRAVIKNYKKDYDFSKLYNTIQGTTELLQLREIKPAVILED